MTLIRRAAVGLACLGLGGAPGPALAQQGQLPSQIRTPVSDSLLFEAVASGTWASGDYMENFFGVTPGDAAHSGLRPYDANSGFKDVAFSASLTYSLSAHWSLTALGSYERLLGDAAD